MPDINTKLLFEMRDQVKDSLKNWDVKGIIDSSKNIFVISQDTKLLSKVFELTIAPIFYHFAKKYNLEIVPAPTQIAYPDYSFRGKALGTEDKWIALDIKSSYFIDSQTISGFTLGTFRGCMRDQTSTTYSTLPYVDYIDHWCLCIIYKRSEGITEDRCYSLDNFDKIPQVVSDIEVILQPKYKLAWYTPGSGNTANIGSVTNIEDIRKGTGSFADLGFEVFEDYWINYLRKEDAKKIGLKKAPYKNLTTYFEWKKKQNKRRIAH